MAVNSGTGAVAWAALLLALAALGFAVAGGGRSALDGEEESEADLASAENLEGRLHDVERRLESLEGRLSEVEPRLARAEEDARVARGGVERVERLAAGGSPGAGAGEVEIPEDEAAKRAELDGILQDIRLGDIGADGAFPMMERARVLGGLDEAVKEMERFVDAHPADPGALVNLGFAFSSKLLSLPEGPARGAWAAKALAAYDAALKIDPDHWGAQFHKAFNLSQWPGFTNRHAEAIATFETLVEKQERTSPEPKFVQTYLQLGNTWREAGNSGKALEVYRRGLEFFPADEELGRQVRILEKR